MIIQDKLVKELNDAKNAVEEYVYDLRDKLCGIYEKYITEGVSAALLNTVADKCPWHSHLWSKCSKKDLVIICFVFGLIIGQQPADADAGGNRELAIWGRRGPTKTSLWGEARSTQGWFWVIATSAVLFFSSWISFADLLSLSERITVINVYMYSRGWVSPFRTGRESMRTGPGPLKSWGRNYNSTLSFWIVLNRR